MCTGGKGFGTGGGLVGEQTVFYFDAGSLTCLQVCFQSARRMRDEPAQIGIWDKSVVPLTQACKGERRQPWRWRGQVPGTLTLALCARAIPVLICDPLALALVAWYVPLAEARLQYVHARSVASAWGEFKVVSLVPGSLFLEVLTLAISVEVPNSCSGWGNRIGLFGEFPVYGTSTETTVAGNKGDKRDGGCHWDN